MAIAVVGALAVNPDATAHAWRAFRTQIARGQRATLGFFARFIPWLHSSATVNAGTLSGRVNLNATVTGYARGVVGWGPHATTAEQLEILDRRTRALDKELGELQQKVDAVEKRLGHELANAVAELRGEILKIRESVEVLRRSAVQLDASALPIVVVGVVLSGLSPDAPRFQVWLWAVLLAGALAFTVWRTERIFRDWRRSSVGA